MLGEGLRSVVRLSTLDRFDAGSASGESDRFLFSEEGEPEAGEGPTCFDSASVITGIANTVRFWSLYTGMFVAESLSFMWPLRLSLVHASADGRRKDVGHLCK